MSAPANPHNMECEDIAGILIVRFTTRAIRDDRVIRLMFDQLNRIVEEGRKKLILNFGGVEAFASYAIGKLIVLNSKLQPPEGRLALCNLTPIVDEIVDIMRLRKQFTIYPTEREAIEALS